MQCVPRHIRYMVLKEWARTNQVEAKLAFPKLRGKLSVPDWLTLALNQRRKIKYCRYSQQASIMWFLPTASVFWLRREFGPLKWKMDNWPEYYGKSPQYLHKEEMIHASTSLCPRKATVIYDRLAGRKKRRLPSAYW